jgi:phage terminase small subunit
MGIFMAGRKPLPTKVKQIKGTLQKCRTNLREPKPQGDLVDPPDYMPEGAKAAWRYALECAPPHLLKRLDMSVLEIWACAADLYRKAQAGIAKTGLLVKAPNTGVPKMPLTHGRTLPVDGAFELRGGCQALRGAGVVWGNPGLPLGAEGLSATTG